MTLKKIATTAQLADIMTKGITRPQWEMCIKGLLGKPLEPSLIKSAIMAPWLRRGRTNCTYQPYKMHFGYASCATSCLRRGVDIIW